MHRLIAVFCASCVALGITASDALGIVIDNPSPLPPGTVSVSYSQTLTASGTVYPEWSTTSGTLPPGLALDPFTGDILGTPTDAATYSFTVFVREIGTPDYAIKDFELNVASPLGVGPVLPLRTEMARPYPNPFRGATKIPVTFATRSRVRLEVLDLRGAIVRELLNEEVGSGRRELSWDGRDQAGVESPTGLDFVRLKANGANLTRRILLAR